MAAEWPNRTLRDAGVTLIDCDHRTPPAVETGYPYVTIPQMQEGRLNLAEARKIAPDHFQEWTRKARPAANDVVLSRRCNPGETAYVSPDMEFALGQNLVLLRANGEDIHPPFLRWLVRGPQWWEQVGRFLNVGAVFDSLKCADIPKFELKVPPLEEQRAIAHILGTLDDKIELNRRMNETLEAMARALFKSWFVDFDPVRAKMAGRARQDGARSGQPRKPLNVRSDLPWPGAKAGAGAEGDPGLPKDIADLFPDRLVESELGEIPEGWDVVPLGDVCRRVAMGPFGSDIKTDNFVEAGVPVVRGSNLTKGFVEDSYVFVSEGKADELRNANAFPGDIVITHRGTLGQVGLIPDRSRFPRYVVSQSQMLLSVQPERVSASYVFEFLRSPAGQHALLANTSQTGVPAISRPTTSLRAIRLLLPSQPVIAQLDSAVLRLYARRDAATSECRSLAALRDCLLPKLLSGAIDVNKSVGDRQGLIA